MRRKRAEVITSGQDHQKLRKKWLEELAQGEKWPSKNSEFMGRAGKDKVREMREEIEGDQKKKRR